MTVDEKFCNHRKGYKKLDCTVSAAMNLAPPNEYFLGSEESRVSLRFRPNDYDNNQTLVIRMSRVEAKQLGEQLVRYGNMALDCEKILTTSTTPAKVEQ